MGIGTEVGFDVGGRLAQGGALVHAAIQGTLDGIAIRRQQAADSVTELAIRLQESRAAQRAAERRSAAAEGELAGALAEIRMLRDALRAEKRLTAGLREVCGV